MNRLIDFMATAVVQSDSMRKDCPRGPFEQIELGISAQKQVASGV